MKAPLTDYVKNLIAQENAKVAGAADNDAGYGKKYWIYFVDSGNWVEGTRAGFEKAIKDGRPVRRTRSMPRKAPEILKETGVVQ